MNKATSEDRENEAEKIRLILQGDSRAVGWLCETYQNRLNAVCVYLLGWRDPEAEDVVQDTFIIAIRKLPEFRGSSSLYTWLNGICVNKCRERIRARIRESEASRKDLDQLIHPSACPEELDGDVDVATNRRLGLLSQMMEKLPEQCRQLIREKDFENRSYAELAVIHKMVISTVGVTLKRCREKLKNLILGAENGGPND